MVDHLGPHAKAKVLITKLSWEGGILAAAWWPGGTYLLPCVVTQVGWLHLAARGHHHLSTLISCS